VNPALFLVARLTPPSDEESFDWVTNDGAPFESIDPLDFLTAAEVGVLFDLYRNAYAALGLALNVSQPAELVEYNRWVIAEDVRGTTIAFVCFKTTSWGLKLGLVATDSSPEAKEWVKTILRRTLTQDAVYAEVSNGVEVAVQGHVPVVDVSTAREILVDKRIEPDEDGLHYQRTITNVGPKKKLMVGRPLPLD